jgi:hypothetical protein
MRTTRFITAGLAVALVSGAIAGPAAAVPALDNGPSNSASTAVSAARLNSDARPIPQPPTWPLHPQPITQVATMDDGRPIPQPPTWPLHPKVIPPPASTPPATVVAPHFASPFDWGAAAIGAATTLAALSLLLAAGVAIRRRRVGPPARLT